MILLAAALALPSTPTNLYFAFTILVFLISRQELGVIEGIKTDRLLLLHFLYLGLIIITASREENFRSFTKVLENQFLLILPFFFYKLQMTDDEYRKVIKFYILGVVYACIVNLILVIERLPLIHNFYEFSWHLGKASWFTSNYQALFGSFAVLALFGTFFEKKLFSWAWSIVILLFLLGFLAVLGSRTSFFSMLLLMFCLLAIKATKNRTFLVVLIVFVMAVPVLVFTVPYFSNRVVVLFTHGFIADPRWYIYQAVENVLAARPWLGLGFTGRDEALLDQYTNVIPWLEGMDIKYNGHSQFFDTAMVCGLPGIALLVAIYGVGLYRAIKRRSFLAIAFAAMIILNSLTESLLERNKGILLFSFFTGLLLINQVDNRASKNSSVNAPKQ